MTAIIMGVFVVHGIVPGPSLFADRPEIVNGIFAGLLVLNVLVMAMLLWGVKAAGRLALREPAASSAWPSWPCAWWAPIPLPTPGTSSGCRWPSGVRPDVARAAASPTIPMVLGMVMGDTLEANLRQVLSVSEGSFMPFVQLAPGRGHGGVHAADPGWGWIQRALDATWRRLRSER